MEKCTCKTIKGNVMRLNCRFDAWVAATGTNKMSERAKQQLIDDLLPICRKRISEQPNKK